MSKTPHCSCAMLRIMPFDRVIRPRPALEKESEVTYDVQDDVNKLKE